MNYSVQTITRKAKLLWTGEGISYEYQRKWLIPIFLAGFLIAIFSPTTVLSDNKLLSIYADTMAQTISLCGGKKNKSEFPEVTKLYLATTCWSIPFVFLVCWKYLNSQINIQDTPLFRDPKTIMGRIQLSAILIFLLTLLSLTLMSDSTGKDTRAHTHDARFNLGLFGILTGGSGVAALTAGFLFSAKRLFTFNFKGTN